MGLEGQCWNCEFWNPQVELWIFEKGESLGECDQVNAPEPVVRLRLYHTALSSDGHFGNQPGQDTRVRVLSRTDEYAAELVTPSDFGCTSWQPKIDRPEEGPTC